MSSVPYNRFCFWAVFIDILHEVEWWNSGITRLYPCEKEHQTRSFTIEEGSERYSFPLTEEDCSLPQRILRYNDSGLEVESNELQAVWWTSKNLQFYVFEQLRYYRPTNFFLPDIAFFRGSQSDKSFYTKITISIITWIIAHSLSCCS